MAKADTGIKGSDDGWINITVMEGSDWSTVRSLAELDVNLRRMLRRARSYKRWFELVLVPTLYAVHKKHFKTNGAFGGQAAAWAEPYSDTYRKWKLKKTRRRLKERLGFDTTTQSPRSFQLMESLTGRSPHNILEIRKDSLVFGSKAHDENGFIYVGVQQFGGDTRKGTGEYLGKPNKGGGRKQSKWHKNRSENSRDRIPARPPIVTKVPAEVADAIQNSFMEWITDGRYVRPAV